MLFTYTYVPHQMDKMQRFIDFIFHEVWCKAPIGLDFQPDLFDGEPDLKEVMTEFGFSTKAAVRGKTFYKDIKAIYELFAPLSPQDIDQFKLWYGGNNDLERVCANDPNIRIVRYADIPVAQKELSEQLAGFFKDLYSQSLLNLAPLRAKIGDINDHYQTFVATNKPKKCPFCGITIIKRSNHTKREAYDHYLPKALYPFNSINFRNLAPACHDCNSAYKGTKDPIHNAKGRRKAFNPYSKTAHVVRIKITLTHTDFDRLGDSDIIMEFGPTDLVEELETWRDLYGIDERYKAMLRDGDAQYWFQQVVDEGLPTNEQIAERLKKILKDAQNSPYAEYNFLKRPFLEACQQMGLF